MALYVTEYGLEKLADSDFYTDGTLYDVEVALFSDVAVDFFGDITPLENADLSSEYAIKNDRLKEVNVKNYGRKTFTTTIRKIGDYTYLCFDDVVVFDFVDEMDRTELRAVGFVDPDDNALIAITTTPLDSFPRPYFKNGDVVNVKKDESVKYLGIGQRWALKWIGGAAADELAPEEGPITLSVGTMDFEASHSESAWLIPQRINYIANPSFERVVEPDSTPDFWQSNQFTGTFPDEECLISRVSSSDIDILFPGQHAGYFWTNNSLSSDSYSVYNRDSRIYAVSNMFVSDEIQFTFQARVAGVGRVRAGLASYNAYLNKYTVDWGLQGDGFFQEWTLSMNGFRSISGIRSVSDFPQMRLVFEVRGYWDDPEDDYSFVFPQLYLDNVLLEPGTLLGWPYFDGDNTFGMGSLASRNTSDFSWYGNVPYDAKRGASYSFWYNNRAASAGRLFGRYLDDTALYTSTDEQKDGLVYQWVPTGTVVIPQFDVLKAYDLKHPPIPDKWGWDITGQMDPNSVQPFAAVLEDGEGNSLVTFSYTDGYFTMTIPLLHEAGHPVARAYVLTSGRQSVEIVSSTYSLQGFNPLEPDAGQVESSITLRWWLYSGDNQVLYIERGDAESPQSWVEIPLAPYVDGYMFASSATASSDAFDATPIPPAPNPTLWLDGSNDDMFTYASGSNIASWLDLAGPNDDMTQPNYPTYGYPVRAGYQNGLQYVSKTAVDQFLQGNTVELYGHLPFSVIIVARRTATSDQAILFSTASSGLGGVGVGYSNTGKVGFIDHSGSDSAHWSSADASGDFEIITYLKNGTYGVGIGRSVLMLGSTVLFDADTVHTDNLDHTIIFERNGSPGTADIAEIIFYNRFLTEDEINVTHSYLQDKWGI